MKYRKSINSQTIQFTVDGEYFLIGDTIRVEFKGETIVGIVVGIEHLPKNYQRFGILIEEPLAIHHIGTAYDHPRTETNHS